MKKKNNSVFFSCVLDGMYTEFKIEENSFEKISESFKREVYYNNRYASIYTDEEMTRAGMREIFFKNVLEGKYLNLGTLKEENDEIFKQWVREFLADVKLEKTFSLSAKDIPAYFRAMRSCGLVENNRSLCEAQMKLYEDGCQNTEALKENGIILKNDSFELKEMPQNKQEKAVVYEKKTVPFHIRKIS